MIEANVAAKNRELASFETIKEIRTVPEFTIENGQLTPTLKIKKNLVVVENWAEIEARDAEINLREDVRSNGFPFGREAAASPRSSGKSVPS